MTCQNDYDRAIVGFVILVMVIIIIALSGCASNTPSAPIAIAGDGNAPIDLTQDTEQTVNNVWPWMIALIAQPVLFLAFLYFSTAWKGRRGF